TVTPVNDGPVFISYPGIVYPGESLVVSTEYLTSYDPDSDAQALIYTVNSVSPQGKLMMNGGELKLGSQFKQADLDAGRITFVPNTVMTDTVVNINLGLKDNFN